MDKTSKIWNIETGIEIFEMRHEGEVIECSFNTDGDKILTGGFGHTKNLDSYNGNLIANLNEHKEEISGVHCISYFISCFFVIIMFNYFFY